MRFPIVRCGIAGQQQSADAIDHAKFFSRSHRAVIRVCDEAGSEQSAYGDGAGVVAVALKPSVVSDVGLGPSSGVGVGVASDFVLAPCPAPWLAPFLFLPFHHPILFPYQRPVRFPLTAAPARAVWCAP